MRLKDLFENQSVRTALLFLGGVLAVGLLVGTIRGLDSSIEDMKLGYSNPVAEPYVITADGGGAATTTEFIGSVLPRTDNVYNLGSALKRWATIYVGSLVPSGSIIPDTDNAYGLGSLTNRWRTGYFGTSVSSTQFISGPGSLSEPAYRGFDADSGIRFISGGADIQIVRNATSRMIIDGTGVGINSLPLYAGTNNGIDVGTTGNRFRTLYLGTSQIFSSGATGIQMYNTADETTNFERAISRWTGNVYEIGTFAGGSGSIRTLRLGVEGSVGTGTLARTLVIGGTGITGRFSFNDSTSATGLAAIGVNGTLSASSGLQYGIAVNSVFNQSGTAGYTALLINPTESSTGSGDKRLISAQVGSADRFFVDNIGNVFASSTVNIGNNAQSAGALTNASSLPLYISYNPSQNQADQGNTAILVQNASSTLPTGLTFTNEDGTRTLFSINVFGSDVPVREDFGFSPANMTMAESASGTIMLTGDNGLAVFSDGPFRPISGLGFGNSDDIAGTASTTISNGNMASASLDFPNSAAAGTQDLTISVVGASDGDECQLGVPNALASRASEAFTCFVSASDTITVRRTCVAGAGCGDPGSATVKAGFFARS